jgi:hypothetical protein
MTLLILAFIFLDFNDGTQFLLILVISLLENRFGIPENKFGPQDFTSKVFNKAVV